jgi:iron complex outermembrane receptor protein
VTAVTAAVLTALYAGHASAADADTDEPQSSGMSLQEVVVTATRRAALGARSADQYHCGDRRGPWSKPASKTRRELARSMAGVNFTDKGPFSGINGSGLIIRGLNSEGTAGPVGPLLRRSCRRWRRTLAIHRCISTFGLQDMDRVEVLRGPQGTLYGSGSLGGTIRYVQNAPDPSGFDARAEVGISDTQHTHAPNESINGMLNLPISDTLAVRLNAGWSYDAGLHQPTESVRAQSQMVHRHVCRTGQPLQSAGDLRQNGTNSYEYHSARVSALWKPNELFTAELNYYYQLGVAHGFPYAAIELGRVQHAIESPDPDSPGEHQPVRRRAALQRIGSPGVDSLSNADNSLEGAHDAMDLVSMTLTFDAGFCHAELEYLLGQAPQPFERRSDRRLHQFLVLSGHCMGRTRALS